MSEIKATENFYYYGTQETISRGIFVVKGHHKRRLTNAVVAEI